MLKNWEEVNSSLAKRRECFAEALQGQPLLVVQSKLDDCGISSKDNEKSTTKKVLKSMASVFFGTHSNQLMDV